MKLYNYWISFNDTRTGKFDRTDRARASWRTSRSAAEKNLNKDLSWCRNNTGAMVAVADYGISEQEFPDTVVLEGILGDNGQAYEDFEITIGEQTLYNVLYDKYKGNRVKLTLAILPDNDDTL